jgi:hypothetical protein
MRIYDNGTYEVRVMKNQVQVTGKGQQWTSEPIRYTPQANGKDQTFEAWCGGCGDDLQIQIGTIDDMTLVWLYDNRPGNANFGYSINLDVPYYSEWGYAPFPEKGETIEQHVDRWEQNIRNMIDALGGEKVAVIDVSHPDVKTIDDLVAQVRKDTGTDV